MATIPVNPERRDPGYLRKKADIGLSNVDNISATDFINTVADDVKIIGNRKILTTKFSDRQGKECYIGILKTPDTGLSAHVNFSTGLFKDDVLDKELSQFNVDFSYSTKTSSSTGTLGYSIQVPDLDPYLSNLEILFTQVGAILYVILYTKSLPVENTSNYFNQIGTDITEWTEGVCLIEDTSDELSKLVKSGKELARLKLDSSHTTIQSEYCESLPVYNKKDGSRVLVESKNYSSAELEELDYPTINGVPFIARKGMKINNQEENNARNITVSAKHPGSTREEAGGHDWGVLDNFLATYYKTVKGPVAYGKPQRTYHRSTTHILQNDDSELSYGYGLCKLAEYVNITNTGTIENYDDASEKALNWLDTLGPNDSDVITVGLFKHFMNFMFNYVFTNMKTTSSEESTVVSYSAWNINIKADTSTVSHEGETRDIWISADRIKTTTTYNSDGEEIDSTSETEAADTSQISVSADDGNIYSRSDKWEYQIPENTTPYEKTYNLLVYVDPGKSSEKFETITYTQEAYEDEVINTNYNVETFGTITTVAALENTQDICYLIRVEKTYASGNTSTEYYNGEEVKITVPNATVKYVKNGFYQVTYPANIDVTDKSYSVTLKYETIEQSITVIQSAAEETDTIIDFGYLFNANPQQVVFETTGGNKVIDTSSYSCEIHSMSNPVKIEELAYTVTSKPSWITIDNSNSDFIYSLCISAENNNSESERQGEIVLTQNTSGNTLTLAVSQKAEVPTVVSNIWQVYVINIDTSTVKLAGETRDYGITYKNVITYSNGYESTSYYSRKDISVEVKTINGNKTATAEYDNGWKITFPESTTENTYQITATYQGIKSETRTIYQGKSKTKTEYVFEINKVEATNADGSSVGSYNSNTKIISFPNLSGKIKVYINSYTVDYFNDGTSVFNTTDFIPFNYETGNYISSISQDSNVLTLDVPENTSTQRTDSIQVTQNISGKILTFYVTQEISTVEYSIKIGSAAYDEPVKCGNSENFVLPDFDNGQEETILTQYVALKPVKTVNGVDTEMSGSEISVSESINWLKTSYNSSTGLLSIDATANNSGSIRKGTIYLIYKNGGVTVSMSVSQKAGSSYITIEESTGVSMYTVSKSKEAQTVILNVESNYPYRILAGFGIWISVVDGISKSAGSSIITFDLEQNNYSSDRSCNFTLTSEGGTTRVIRVTQFSRTNYIDVVGFEGSDIIATTSSWKKQISIPIKANQQIFIDYYSDWLKTGFYVSDKTDTNYYDSATYYNPTSIIEDTQYLFISPVNPSATNTGGVVSLSYYDSTSGTIVCGRKIFVNNLPDANVLPYGPRDIFIPGNSDGMYLYAYVKSGVTDLSSYLKKKSAVNDTSEGEWTTDYPDTKELASVNIIYDNNPGTEYRDLYYTLYSKNAGDTDELAETLPEFRVHQYPRIYLDCYYNGSLYGKHSKNLRVSSEGDENIPIQATSNCCSGYWEFYGNSIPGWISVIGDVSIEQDGSNSFGIRVEPNFDTESRSTKLQFWCDSDHNTINTITITQEGSTVKASRNAEYDFSLVTAKTETNYLYLYGVTSAYVAKTIGSDGNSENINAINTTITTVDSNTLRIEYSIGSENTYYNKDIYKVLNLNCEDGITRQFFIKNPRTQDVTIEISRDNLYYSSGYKNASDNLIISSNIGLTGFYQATCYDLEKSSMEFTTLDVLSEKSYSFQTNYCNPEKLFYKPQIMDKFLLRNMDVIPGYTYEKTVLLPARTDTTLKSRGIGIYTSLDDSSMISDINSTETSTYTMSLPSNQKNSSGTQLYTQWYFKAYDGVTISKSGDGFELSSDQSYTAQKVGSLGKSMLSVSALSDNTGTSSKYLGSITLSITNGIQKIIHIYQAANVVNLVGKVRLNAVKENSSDYSEKWTSTEANLIFRDSDSSWNLTFVHEYSNWMFIDLLGNTNFTFNGKSYSGTFGEGGNSGTALSVLSSKIDGCDYKSTVSLTPPKFGLLFSNETLEMLEGGRYGLISTYGTSNITDKSNVKSIVHVYTRPDRPDFTVYNSSGVKVIDSSGKEGTGIISSFGVSTALNQLRKNYTVVFRLMSNYIDRCKTYIGKTIKLDGQEVKIETEYDLFLKLIDGINIKYSDSGVETTKTVTLSSYTTGESNGNSYIQYAVLIRTATTIINKSGSLNITLNDFVIDSSLYYAALPLSVSVPIYFNSKDISIDVDPDIPTIDTGDTIIPNLDV
jgi:hypothetical protein